MPWPPSPWQAGFPWAVFFPSCWYWLPGGWAAWVWVTIHLLGLTESVSRVLDRAAISFGDFRLSALTVINALVVTGLLIAGARLLSQIISARLARNEDISPTMRVLTAKLLQVILFSMAVIIGLKAVGFDLTGLAVFSGAVGVGLGFGLQKVVSNLVSGIIILLDRSIKPGDVISLGDTFGWIEELGARYVSDSRMLEVAELTGVTELARQHPQGFDRPVGERGQLLSGGQRQAVLLARALLLDPPILLLDEPTSAMDNTSEDILRNRLQSWSQGKTLLLITHRSSMLSLVDRLIVLDYGHVVADGPKEAVIDALRRGRVGPAAV